MENSKTLTQQRRRSVVKSERAMSASTTADAESPSAIVRWAQTRRPRRDSEDSVKSKLELAIRRTSCSPLTNTGTKSAPDGTLLVYRTESMATAVKANAFLKTKMCPKLRMNADGLWSCPQGDRCSFAHSESELRLLPNLTKTAICYEQVYGKCGCKNGALCKYAHSEEELRNYVPLGAPHGRQYNNNRHGSGGSVSGSKRKSSQTCEEPCINGRGNGRRCSKESVVSGINTTPISTSPKPIDLPGLRMRALEIAQTLPASTGKHLAITRDQLVDEVDHPCIAQYLCSICGALASPTPDPTIASACTHVTCARCFEGWRRANVEQEPKLKTLPCPSCGCPLRKGIDVFPFNESVGGPIAVLLRVYRKIRISCNKVDEVLNIPCKWIGSVRDFPEHMVVCHHWECVLETLPSCTAKGDAGDSRTPHSILDRQPGTVPPTVGTTSVWDDISPAAEPSALLKTSGTSRVGPGLEEELLMFSPARVVDDHGDRSAVACSSTTSTVTGAHRSIGGRQQLDNYSNRSDMMTSITPDKVSLPADSSLEHIHVEELASANCEAICDFVPYGAFADKMLEISAGQVFQCSCVTDDGQWSLVIRPSTGEQGWVPKSYLQSPSREVTEHSPDPISCYSITDGCDHSNTAGDEDSGLSRGNSFTSPHIRYYEEPPSESLYCKEVPICAQRGAFENDEVKSPAVPHDCPTSGLDHDKCFYPRLMPLWS